MSTWNDKPNDYEHALHYIERLEAAIQGIDRDRAILCEAKNAEIAELKAEIERLRAALKECADDLEAELNGHYQNTLDYPSQQLKFERDMEPVLVARKLLDQK